MPVREITATTAYRAIEKPTTSFATFIHDAAQINPSMTSGLERFLVDATTFSSPALRRVATHVKIGVAVLETLPASRVPPEDRQHMKLQLLNADLYRFPLPFGLTVGFGQLGLDSGVVYDRHRATSEYRDMYEAYRNRHAEVATLVQRGMPLADAMQKVPWPRNVGMPPVVDTAAKRLHDLWISQACEAFYERQRAKEAERKASLVLPKVNLAFSHRRQQIRLV